MNEIHGTNRRSFLGRIGTVGVSAAFGLPHAHGESGAAPLEWDLSWIKQIQRARHRALFDAPMPNNVLDLAARYFANLVTVYGSSRDACAILNLRTRSVSMGLADALWQKYPIGDDAKVTDPDTGANARRNIYWKIPPAQTQMGYGSLELLRNSGAIPLVCDFALGHLATRLSKAANVQADVVLAELRTGLVPGAILVPSGIFAAAEAQNAGCAFIPT
jgi:hypothetical protein